MALNTAIQYLKNNKDINTILVTAAEVGSIFGNINDDENLFTKA